MVTNFGLKAGFKPGPKIKSDFSAQALFYFPYKHFLTLTERQRYENSNL